MSQVDNLHVDAVTGLKLGIGAEGTGRNASSVYIGIMFEDANGNTSQSLTTNLLTLKNNVADPTVTGWNTTYLTQFADKALIKLNKDFPALVRAAAKPRAINGSLVPGNPKLGVAIANATKKAPTLLKEPEFPGTPPVMVTQLAVKEGVVTAVTKRMVQIDEKIVPVHMTGRQFLANAKKGSNAKVFFAVQLAYDSNKNVINVQIKGERAFLGIKQEEKPFELVLNAADKAKLAVANLDPGATLTSLASPSAKVGLLADEDESEEDNNLFLVEDSDDGDDDYTVDQDISDATTVAPIPAKLVKKRTAKRGKAAPVPATPKKARAARAKK